MDVLIIDDDKDCLNDIADALDPLNYTCIKELSPLAAIEKYKKNKFDVVITDIKMPEMNGIEVLRNIKNIDKNARVIIITGYGDLDTAVQAINNHAYAFFGKPIDFKELVETLRIIEEELNKDDDLNIDYKKLSDEYKELKKSYDDLLDVVKSFQEDNS